MKKLIALAFSAALAATAAHAGSQTIEFTNAESGTVQSWTFNTDGTASGPGDIAATYTWDLEAKTLCADVVADEPQKLCVTFAEVQETPEVGFETAYTADNGSAGTAKLVAIETDEAGEKAAMADEEEKEALAN